MKSAKILQFAARWVKMSGERAVNFNFRHTFTR